MTSGTNLDGTVASIGTQCNGAALLRAFEAAAESLAGHVEEVNALNVYPVPDGDTGTNLLHTVRAALDHARAAGPTLPAIAAAAAHGSLMGARGNSGVILSQVFRGLKDAVGGRESLGGAQMREAFIRARAHAVAAVTVPAPGTMLTLLDEIAASVEGLEGDAAAILERAVLVGEAAVARTREQNPTNRAAGVIDAGARGLWLLLEGARASLGAGAPRAMVLPPPVGAAPPLRAPAGAPEATGVPSWEGAYDVQFLIERPTRTAAALREEMLEFGADCVLVVGDEAVVKVHVHTLAPDQILRIGLTAGRIADVVVEDLDAMSAEHERATGIVVRPPRRPLGLVVVVPGEGLAEVVRALGAVALRGGASMNPSTEELLEAVRGVNAERVILLPNDRNVILAARQVAAIESGVTVVPTENVAQGMAALVAFAGDLDHDEAVARMVAAAASSRCLELTRAVREAEIQGKAVPAGDALALLDGTVVATGPDELDVLARAAAGLAESELLTLYVGASVSAERAARARECLSKACPRAQVEVLEGGQPHYPFVVQAD